MAEPNVFDDILNSELEVEDSTDLPTDKVFILNEVGEVVELEVADDDGDDQT